MTLSLLVPRIERRIAVIESRVARLNSAEPLTREWAAAISTDESEVDYLLASANLARLRARAMAKLGRGGR